MDETGPAHSWLPNFLNNSDKKRSSSGESSTLLPKAVNGYGIQPNQENGEIYNINDEEKPRTRQILKEFQILLKGSIPVILAYTLQNSLQTISVVIVGRRSPEDLATAAFSYMFAMSTAWLIALGGTTALDTLCSSTFTGSKDRHDLGVLLQRAFIILGLFYVPVAVLWFCSEPVFKALGQGEQISHDSARFLWCLIPGGLGYIYFECMKKYLQAQGMLAATGIIINNNNTNISRNHATRNLCSPNHVANQCGPQFSLRLHFEDGLTGCAHCHGHLLLAIIFASTGLRSFCPRVGRMGRLVQEMST